MSTKTYHAAIEISDEPVQPGDVVLFNGRFGFKIYQVREIVDGIVYTYSGGPIGPENTGIMVGLQYCKKLVGVRLGQEYKS